MNYKLVIAEKPSVAASISAVLNAKKREDGFFIENGYIVSWCVGHLVELATADTYNEKYAKWRYEDLPIIPTAWKYAAPKDKKKQFKILSDLMSLLFISAFDYIETKAGQRTNDV